MLKPPPIERAGLHPLFTSRPDATLGDWPICKVCDIADWDHPAFREQVIEIMRWGPDADLRHRKVWEFAQTIHALRTHQLLDEHAVGLSVAAGRERLLFYLANQIGMVVATDMYGTGPFASREADRRFVNDQRSFEPFEFRMERLKVLFMNALRLQFESNTFDFAYSLSSIEHFGGLGAAIQSLREMVRVVKPGGLVIVTTEVRLNDRPSIETFTVEEIDALVAGVGVALIEPITYCLSDRTLQIVTDFDHGDLYKFPHINLRRQSGAIFTSITLAFQKPMSSETTQWYPLLQTDLEWLVGDIEAIRNIYPQEAMPRLIHQGLPTMMLQSPYTRLPLIGRLWQRLRRPLHELITFYLNEQARRQAEDVNLWMETHMFTIMDKLLELDRASRAQR